MTTEKSPAGTSTPQMVWLARHGIRRDFVDSEWRKQATKPFDTPLAPAGVTQAKELGVHLKGSGIRQIFASPFRRTIETAHHAAAALNIPVRIEPGAAEWLNTEWFGDTVPDIISAAEVAREFPRVDLTYTPVMPISELAIETADEHGVRTKKTILGLTTAQADHFLVVGHGASAIGMAVGLVERIEGDVQQASLACAVRSAGGWVLQHGFSTEHLSITEDNFRLA